jgi:AraC-like DNA-binding protein
MTSTNLIPILCAIGVLQGVAVAIVLLSARSGHRLANAVMAALVITIALSLLHRWTVYERLWSEYQNFAFVLNSLVYAWGPLLYLYAYSLTQGSLNHRQWLHFLPLALAFLGMNLPLWTLSSTGQQELIAHMWVIQQDVPGETPMMGRQQDVLGETHIWGLPHSLWHPMMTYLYHGILSSVHMVCYCLLVLRQIRQHNRRLEQHFSSLEKMNLRWLHALSIACLAVMGFYLVFNRIPTIVGGPIDIAGLGANLHLIVIVLLLYGIAISALFQPSLISGVKQASGSEPIRPGTRDHRPSHNDADSPVSNAAAATRDTQSVDTPPQNSGKYRRARLDIEEAHRYKIALMEAMEEQELYLDSDLALPDLARATGLAAPRISQVLNGQMNQNFFSFVNSYRVQLAQSMLLDSETSGMPIVELALEVGFKSKSSFYDAFKRVTDMTPTQFKQAMKTSPEVDDEPA